jgi:hypothetical protein
MVIFQFLNSTNDTLLVHKTKEDTLHDVLNVFNLTIL